MKRIILWITANKNYFWWFSGVVAGGWALFFAYYQSVIIPRLKPPRIVVNFEDKLISEEKYFNVYEIFANINNSGESKVFLSDGYMLTTAYKVMAPASAFSEGSDGGIIFNAQPMEKNYEFIQSWFNIALNSYSKKEPQRTGLVETTYGLFFPERTTRLFLYFAHELTSGATLNPGESINISRIVFIPKNYSFVTIEYFSTASKKEMIKLNGFYFPSSDGIRYIQGNKLNKIIKEKDEDKRIYDFILNSKLVSIYTEQKNAVTYPIKIYKQIYVKKNTESRH